MTRLPALLTALVSLPGTAALASGPGDVPPSPDPAAAEPFAYGSDPDEVRPKPGKTRRRQERQSYGGELVLRVGPALPVFPGTRDALDPDGEVDVSYGFAVRVEGHALASPRSSLWLQFGYAQRRAIWDAPSAPSGVPPLETISSRVDLFHVGARFRPVFQRASPFLSVGLGPDLVVHEVGYGGASDTETFLGLGIQAAAGVDLFLGPKAALHLDVRNALSLYAPRSRAVGHDIEDDEGNVVETIDVYDIHFGPFEDTVDLSLGVTIRL